MPSGENSGEIDFEQASSQLNRGLKNCRAVINDYRAMLTGDQESSSDEDGDSDVSRYVSTTANTANVYGSSGAN